MRKIKFVILYLILIFYNSFGMNTNKTALTIGNLSNAKVKIYEITDNGKLILKWLKKTTTGDELYQTLIDITNKRNFSVVNSLYIPGVYDLLISNTKDKAYVAIGKKGFRIIGIVDITNPKIISSINISNYTKNKVIAITDTSGYAKSMILSKDKKRLYTVNGNEGFFIIDISNFIIPKIISSITTSDAHDIVISEDGSKVYIANGNKGIQIVDVSDSRNPKIVGSVDTPGHAVSLAMSKDGSKLYVADYTEGIQIVDVSDSRNPKIVGSVDTPGYAVNLAISKDGSKLYVACYEEGIYVIDITNSKRPKIINIINIPEVSSLLLSENGSEIYVLASDIISSKLDIIDIREKKIVGSVELPGIPNDIWEIQPHGLVALGKILYVANYDGGLQIIDVSNPEKPKIIGSIDILGYAYSVNILKDKNIAYVSDYYKGLKIVDISFCKGVSSSQNGIKRPKRKVSKSYKVSKLYKNIEKVYLKNYKENPKIEIYVDKVMNAFVKKENIDIEYLAKIGVSFTKEDFSVAVVDINNDGLKDILFKVSNALYCGSHGCSSYMYLNQGNKKYKLLSIGLMQSDLVLLLKEKRKKFKDIVIDGKLILTYNGKEYVIKGMFNKRK